MDPIEYWNGPAGDRWAKEQQHIDAGMTAITELLFSFAAPKAGERVLDVGCGAGTTTLRLASLGCEVTGADISRPMLAVARARGANVIECDAAQAPGSYDLVFSRFGVMFFADPPAAFAHLRSVTRRFAFVCWQPYEANPWAHEPMRVAADLLPPPPPVVPDAPGPFGLARPERIRELLPGAEIQSASTTMGVGKTLDEAVAASLMIGPLSRAASEVDEPTRAKIRERMRDLYAPYVSPEGVRLPAAVWLVRA